MYQKKTNFFQAVYHLTYQIPKGKVSTYGQIAGLITTPRAARVVGWALHQLDDQPIPWHRVINSRGEISTSCETHTKVTQKKLLEQEGVKVKVVNGVYMVDLKKYLWQP
ncbi:MAG: methylated-DNA--[protein]-cysteine S-methyltransferase [bacterium]